MSKEKQISHLQAVKTAHEKDLLRKANVVGVGIGHKRREGHSTGEPAIVVSVTRKLPLSQIDPDDVIPDELEGVAVDVQAVGELKAF